MAKIYSQRFVVEGALSFPIDMLRYDACWPYSSEDAAQIRDSIDHDHEGDVRRYRVELVTHSPHSPTTGRWNSFSWQVTNVCPRVVLS